jgi:hypothetical protein
MHLAVVPDAPSPSCPIRSTTDHQADRISRFVARYPQYARLPADVLLQYVDTYRDESDHALEQEFRDNGVLAGCRADLRHALDRGDGWIPFSDDYALEASYDVPA